MECGCKEAPLQDWLYYQIIKPFDTKMNIYLYEYCQKDIFLTATNESQPVRRIRM